MAGGSDFVNVASRGRFCTSKGLPLLAAGLRKSASRSLLGYRRPRLVGGARLVSREKRENIKSMDL